ncbi:hypothetical protein ACXR2U_20265 [Jatrophihabitans sp. YIM 134969]
MTVHVPSARACTPQQVFGTWCRLTGTDPSAFGPDELEAFHARPQVAALVEVPYEVLLDAGIAAARRGSLPLERWLHAVQVVRPVA